MSKFGPIRCFECGQPLDDIYEAYRFMRTLQKPNIHVSKISIIPANYYDSNKENPENSELEIFQTLRIDKICCRQKLMCTVVLDDL